MSRWRVGFSVTAAVLALAAQVSASTASAAGVPPQLSGQESEALVRMDVQNAFDGFVPPPGSFRPTVHTMGRGFGSGGPGERAVIA